VTNPIEPEIFCPLLWTDLAAIDPKLITSLAGAEKAPGGYKIQFLGAEHLVDQEKRLLLGPADRRPIAFLKTMIVLSYLAKAALGPAPGLAGKLVGGFELPGGTLFFRGPHSLPTDKLIQAFGHNPEGLWPRAAEIGAQKAADGSLTYKALPFVELGFYLNPADEEFPAQVQWTFDRHSHYYLALDGLWGLAQVVAAELARID
jgi:hypothetical protein